ncbi:U11/U12 small nuclear ribonucleoprotein 59 kDa protein [Euphorbia peplus]|nr:U11/U12 small nuclear ribonucleoprotein 59 kDa protein [Euphorbia peplus]
MNVIFIFIRFQLELALILEKLQELRSVWIQKLKNKHLLPEDDKFLERIWVTVEEEEQQAMAFADTDAAKDVILTAEESRNFGTLIEVGRAWDAYI